MLNALYTLYKMFLENYASGIKKKLTNESARFTENTLTIDVASKTFDDLYQSYSSCEHEHNGHALCIEL